MIATETTTTVHAEFASPIGLLLAVGDGERLRGLYMQEGPRPVSIPRDSRRDDPALAEVRRQLDEYFTGARREFDLKLDLRGSRFETSVWDALREIPYGETRSYGQIAQRINRPDRARAVGAANARNPVSIIIPCHRVIGADGSLTGYGGGLERKRSLLDLEAPAGGGGQRPKPTPGAVEPAYEQLGLGA